MIIILFDASFDRYPTQNIVLSSLIASCNIKFHLLTTYAVHAVVHRCQQVRSVRDGVVVRGQAQATVSRLLARVVRDAGQEWIHVQSHSLLALPRQ